MVVFLQVLPFTVLGVRGQFIEPYFICNNKSVKACLVVTCETELGKTAGESFIKGFQLYNCL